jgi:hypothetical protein
MLVGWFSQILEWEWLGKLGWLETVTPVMGGELGEQVGNQSNQGGLGGCSGFPVVVRIRYDGFLLGFGVETRVWVQSPGQTILGGSGGGGQFGTGETGGFVGELGWMDDTGLV